MARSKQEFDVASAYLTAINNSEILRLRSEAVAQRIHDAENRTVSPDFKNETLDELPGLIKISKTFVTLLRNVACMGVAAVGTDLAVTAGISMTVPNGIFLWVVGSTSVAAAGGAALSRGYSHAAAKELEDRRERFPNLEADKELLEEIGQQRDDAAKDLVVATKDFIDTFGDSNEPDLTTIAREVRIEYTRALFTPRGSERGSLQPGIGL